jgi:uncharacterized protein YtpQ (UPF0354 family)
MDVNVLREAVVEIIRRKPGVVGVVPDARDPAKIVVRVGEQTSTIDLTNLLNRIRAYPDENKDKLIAEFAASIDDLQNKYFREENIVAVLRTKAYVDQVSEMMRGALAEPLVGELMIVYMADMPSSMSPVVQDALPGKNLAEVRDIALSNVRRWLGNVISDGQLQIATLYYVEGNTMLSPTLILLDEFWTSIADRYPGDALIAVPRRDQLFIANDDVNGRSLVRQLINVTFAEDFNLLSQRIFARRDGKIVAVDERRA